MGAAMDKLRVGFPETVLQMSVTATAKT